MATKFRADLFSCEHPCRGAESVPRPPRRSPGVPGFGGLADAVEGAAALRGAGAAGPGQPRQSRAAEQSHRDPHGELGMELTWLQQRAGLRLVFQPPAAHILLAPFCFQPHWDLPALAESIR